jgi:hypothetical protein
MESKVGEANTQIFNFAWCENILVSISFVNILFFIGQMESEIGEANSHIIIFGWSRLVGMAIS